MYGFIMHFTPNTLTCRTDFTTARHADATKKISFALVDKKSFFDDEGGGSRFSLRLGHSADKPQAIGSEAKAL
jgi:hypothetical protein